MELGPKLIGNTIKQLRKEKGLTQDVLSGLAGIARSHLAMIENGSKKANLETLCKIASALNMRPSDLIKQAEDSSKHEV